VRFVVKGTSSKAARRKARKRAGKIGARRKREFTYRGYTLEELQAMTLPELLPLLPARARRSYSRGLNKEQQRFVERLRNSKKDILRTHRREIVVLPDFVGKKVAIYTGKEYKVVEIIPEMIGHYLGEFAITRTFSKHSGPGVGATRSSKYMPLK
jgi:small subunit ribosomal protein S19